MAIDSSHPPSLTSVFPAKKKEIKFCNQNKRIILQNENGSCPLIAICNVLLLTNDRNVYRNRFQVSHDDLLNLVGDKLFNDSETASAIGCKSYNDLMTGLVNLDTHIVKARSGQSSVDFTATITPSQPCSKKTRSFADTTPTSAEHSKLRKGDIEEQRVLLRALPISERETRGLDTSRNSSSGESVSGYSDEYQMSEDGSLVDSVDTDSSCTSTPGSGNICQKTKCDDQVSSKESGDETASVVGNKIDVGEEVCSTTSGTKINGALDHDHLSSTELGDEMVCDVDTENSSKTTALHVTSSDMISAEKTNLEATKNDNTSENSLTSEAVTFVNPALYEAVYKVESLLGKSSSEGKDTNGLTPREGEVIKNFLDNNASQLTFSGFCSLEQDLNEGELCVFFRNNHFYTMLKYDNALYTLVTDQGYMKKRDLVWEKLYEVNGDSVFVTGDFKSDSGNWDQQSAFSNTAVCASSSDSDEEWESDSEISESDLDDNDEQLQVTDPNGFMMVYPSRSEMLKRLPVGVAEFLKLSVMGLLIKESAKICLGEERFNLLLATTPTDNLYIHDSRCRLYIFWKTGQLLAEYLLDEVVRKRLKNAAGFIRDQCGHLLCWAFAVCDLISICRVIYGWDEEFKPLSPQYLCQNVNPTLYARDIGSESKHSCYGWGGSHALFYVQKHGIVADIPDENYRFDCRERCDSEGIKYGIRSIFRYPTLQQALIRLKTHPVLATLICFEGWDSKDRIYRGPYNGGKYLDKHGVVLIDCTEIDGETVVSCKSSTGRDVGTDGYIIVSVEVMLMAAGATRHSSRPNRRMCATEPTYLVYDIFLLDMEMGPNPKLKENPQQIEENSQFEIVDGRDSA